MEGFGWLDGGVWLDWWIGCLESLDGMNRVDMGLRRDLDRLGGAHENIDSITQNLSMAGFCGRLAMG